MSVVAERAPTGDLREIELRRHLQIMARSLEHAERGSSLTMILRSPSSDPAKALIGLKGGLKRAGLGVLLCEQNLAVARRIADRACIIAQGRLRDTGSIEEMHRCLQEN